QRSEIGIPKRFSSEPRTKVDIRIQLGARNFLLHLGELANLASCARHPCGSNEQPRDVSERCQKLSDTSAGGGASAWGALSGASTFFRNWTTKKSFSFCTVN